MSWTKKNLIDQAFEEIGLAAYVYDLTPEQYQSALRRLDAIVATLEAKGIRLGYPLPSAPNSSSLTVETNVPDTAAEALFTMLAIRIAPQFGKTVSMETKQVARASYLSLLQKAVGVPNERQLQGTLPRGAGNKPWRYDTVYVDQPDDPLAVGPDADFDFE